MVPVLLAALSLHVATPPFVARVTPVSRADLRWSWRPGCPVGPAQLRELRLAYWGFDGARHLGSLVVHADVTDEATRIFRRLYRARFPIRRIEPIDSYRGSDERSMAADNTTAFNCRYAVATGPRRWSEHAYGRAIDVNPRENPYVLGGKVFPPAGRTYLDRVNARAGMAVPGGVLVETFAAAGWQWGGRWRASPDYQHFSADGG
jgi:hypothetical protein